jgi:hypothetical protein
LKRFPATVLNISSWNDPEPGSAQEGGAGIYLVLIVRPLIHKWSLPSPCDPKYRGNDALIEYIISNHPEARSTDTIGMGRAVTIYPGDEINCFKHKDGSWRFDFTKITRVEGNIDTNCLRAKSKAFKNGALLAVGDVTNPKPLTNATLDAGATKPIRVKSAASWKKNDDTFTCVGQPADYKGRTKETKKGTYKNPKPDGTPDPCHCARALGNAGGKGTYKNLPRHSTSFYYYTKPQIKKVIKSLNTEDHVKKTIWCFTSKEQPFKNKGGTAGYPNNNPGGIQTDGGRQYGSKYIAYQTCFADAREFRAFAGFNSVENGFKGMKAMVEGKFRGPRWRKTDGTGPNIPTGTINQQAETLTWLYYRSWNIAASLEKIEALKKTDKWKSTVAQFEASLNEWNT